jgi:hypothetical protein
LVWDWALSFRARSTVMLRAANHVVAWVGKPAQVGAVSRGRRETGKYLTGGSRLWKSGS